MASSVAGSTSIFAASSAIVSARTGDSSERIAVVGLGYVALFGIGSIIGIVLVAWLALRGYGDGGPRT